MAYDEAIHGISAVFCPQKTRKSEKFYQNLQKLQDVKVGRKIEGACQKLREVTEFVLHQYFGLVIFLTTEDLKAFLVCSK